jgi:hypothetical protein
VPITIVRYRRSTLPDLKLKIMVTKNRKIQDVMQILIQKLRVLGVSLTTSGIFVFNVNEMNVVFNPGQKLEDIVSRKEALKDGWLDLVYHDHETF